MRRPTGRCGRAGERLRAVDVAALQAVGIRACRCVREPRARVVAMPGCDAVALAISRAVSAHGANVIFVRALERALADEQTDIVITIGGTGDGRDDASVAMLARMGEVEIHGFGIAPGETAALGAAKGHPGVDAPAGSMAALAAFLLVGEPLLARLTGPTASGKACRSRSREKSSRPSGLPKCAGAPRRRWRRAARLGPLADAGAYARRWLGAGPAGERRLCRPARSLRCGRTPKSPGYSDQRK